MLLKIDFEMDTPIYLQLKNQIIEGIAKKEIAIGESLPSVRQLAVDIGINMHTVNKAYNMLKDEGFIIIDRRRGAVVIKSSNNFDDLYIKSLKLNLTPIIAQALCKGLNEDEFINICKNIYKGLGGK